MNKKQQLNQIIKESPYFKVFNLIRYKSPKGYLDYDKITFILATQLFRIKQKKIYDYFTEKKFVDNDVYRNFNSNLNYSLRQGATLGLRSYWLEKDLVKAFVVSELPKQWKLQTKKLAGIIFIPSNLVKVPEWGKKIQWIYYHLDEKNINLFTILGDYPHFFTSIKRETIINEETSNDDDILASNQETFTIKKVGVKVGGLITNIAIQTLLYIENYEPQLLPSSNTSSKDSSDKPRYLDIEKLPSEGLIVGANYRVKREAKREVSDRLNNSQEFNSPVATHWRSGHWRNQFYGSRDNRTHKTIWIEPVLINKPQ